MKNIIWKIVKSISSLRFSIILLLFLALISVSGTVIEQNQDLEYYKLNYPSNRQALSFFTWKQITGLGLDHLYSNYWFFFILILFFLSLFFCTFSTQLPILRSARRWNFLYAQVSLEKKTSYSAFKYVSLVNLIYILNLKHYYTFHKGKAIYAYKGLIGRLAPIFVHFSIILTLVGNLLGLTYGYVAQEIIPNGEVFHIQNVIQSGRFSSVSNNLLGKVNDFYITFNQDKSVEQFFSSISLLGSQGNILVKKLVSVNSPLRFNGVTFYQTDWKVNALRLKIGSNKLLVKPLKQVNFNGSNVWSCDLVLDTSHKVSIFIPALNNELLIYNDNGSLVQATSYGVWNIIYGVPIVFKDLVSSTGLQIKTDPGIYIAYLGFFILMISIVLSYMSYSQIWANNSSKKLNISGSANRAALSFEDEVVKMYKKYLYLSVFTE